MAVDVAEAYHSKQHDQEATVLGKKLGIVLVGCLLVGMLGGVGMGAQKTEIEWWVGSWICQPEIGKGMAFRAQAEFEAEYPDVKVNVVCVAWEGMLEKFILASQTGQLPDVMTSESAWGWTQLFASYGHYTPITDLVMEIGEDTFFEPVLEGNRFRGEYYSIPYRNSTRVFVWNKDMFEAAGLDPNQPPRTWDEVLEYAQKLTRDTTGDGRIDQWGFTYPVARFTTAAPEYLRAVMFAFGADILNAELTASTLLEPKAIEAVTFYTDLVTKYGVVSPEVISMDDNDDWAAFGTEMAAMAMVGPWALATYDTVWPDVNYGVTTIPSNDPDTVGKFGLVHMAWMVSRHTQDKDAVYDFIRFVLRPEVNAWFADSTPAVLTAWEYEGFTSRYSEEAREVMALQLENSVDSVLLIPAGPQIAREVNVAIQRIILGMDVETSLREAHIIINELIQDQPEY